jgi:uncharacterized membrane protein
MYLSDLGKATVACGGLAFLIYNIPAVAVALNIGLLSLLWLLYAYKTLAYLRRRKSA